MNSGRQEQWPSFPTAEVARGKAGWSVVFARDADGRFPAADYLENADPENPQVRVTPKEKARFLSMFAHAATDGISNMNKRMFKTFIGTDAEDGMAEFLVKAELGHRILCFRAAGRTLLLTNGFRKAAAMKTPTDEKARARRILAAHREYHGTSGRRGR